MAGLEKLSTSSTSCELFTVVNQGHEHLLKKAKSID